MPRVPSIMPLKTFPNFSCFVIQTGTHFSVPGIVRYPILSSIFIFISSSSSPRSIVDYIKSENENYLTKAVAVTDQ